MSWKWIGCNGLCRVAAVAALLATATAAWGQSDGRRIYEEQLRTDLDRQQAAARVMGLDAGGWFTMSFFNYEDGSRKERTLRQYEMRLWASLSLDGVHTFYIRGKTDYEDWNRGANPAGHGDEYNDPTLERAWYRFDYNRLVRNRTGQNPDVGFVTQVGRDFYTIGSGLVLALPLDAVHTTVTTRDWDFTGLIGRTVEDTPNIDGSASVRNDMRRCFYGVQATYKGFSHHRPYAYYLWQFDHTPERPRDPFQNYTYDSRYVGIGSQGVIFDRNLKYLVELAGEQGSSQAFNGGTENIRAMILDSQLEYVFDMDRHPKIMAEYLWASGDGDRGNSTNTINGNAPGTRDSAFNGFGFRDTGLAFAPRMSNLHMLSAGSSFFPFEQHALFRKMEVGAKAYLFAKDAPHGGISDSSADTNSRFLGSEADVFLNWRITSDLSYTIRYGAFRPSDAFTERDLRHFLYTGFMFSF